MERLIGLPWSRVESTVAEVEQTLVDITNSKRIFHYEERTETPSQKSLYFCDPSQQMPNGQRLPVSEISFNSLLFERHLPFGDRFRRTFPRWLQEAVILFSPRYYPISIHEELQTHRLTISGDSWAFTLESVVCRKTDENVEFIIRKKAIECRRLSDRQDRLEHWSISLQFADQALFEKTYDDYHEGKFCVGVGYSDARLPKQYLSWTKKPIREAVLVFGALFNDYAHFIEKNH